MGHYSYCYGKNDKRKKNLDPTQAHMNHVHIELNLSGAAKKTTFWNKNVTYDAPVPVQPPTRTPQTPTQSPTPTQTQPWLGNGQTGGAQQNNSGGTWGGGWN
jgi:hypothetical protein